MTHLERLGEALHDGGGLGADAVEGGDVPHSLEQALRPPVMAHLVGSRVSSEQSVVSSES